MENWGEARDKILTEILSDDAEVRSEYIKHFKDQAEAFAEFMSDAVTAWRSLEQTLRFGWIKMREAHAAG